MQSKLCRICTICLVSGIVLVFSASCASLLVATNRAPGVASGTSLSVYRKLQQPVFAGLCCHRAHIFVRGVLHQMCLSVPFLPVCDERGPASYHAPLWFPGLCSICRPGLVLLNTVPRHSRESYRTSVAQTPSSPSTSTTPAPAYPAPCFWTRPIGKSSKSTVPGNPSSRRWPATAPASIGS